MKKRKSPSLIPLDLDSLGSVLEIFPDTDLMNEIDHYLIIVDEVAHVRPTTHQARKEYAEWLKLSDEEISHIRPKYRGYTASWPKNGICMSADSHALASDWKKVGHVVSEACDEVIREIGQRMKRKKDQEALKHG
ncbi:hypothetical protein ACIPLA_07835 [Pseudomonas sp. NPDC086112]|uniref:hypothetical protein n=1 Tax=Pseudomonas sp. NPDC086112 TaxID=3364430 RepID=UPI00382FADC2